MKRRQSLILLPLVLAVLLLASAIVAPSAYAKGKPPAPKPVTLKAKLVFDAVTYPDGGGMGMYKTDKKGNADLKVSVEGLTALVDQSLDVYLDGNLLGSVVVGATGEAQFRLRTVKGQVVPTVIAGSTVEVSYTGVTVASGVFK